MTLEKIAKEIAKCRKCRLWKCRNRTVPGYGNKKARIMFIGEAPGRNEDLHGRPFVGGSGKFLTEALESIKLTREDVFVTSVLKCRPPDNRNPKKDEEAACMPYLLKQIEIINPKVIVLLGNTAMKAILGYDKVMTHHGCLIKKDKRKYIPTLHPAAVMRMKKYKKTFMGDFKKIKKYA